ncbi:no exine formation [Anaeramoeba flamelloides]|uniref:No exine formation n=1 Tax=Anaeramoeba flamelloides TaxID=1746091 RepID=A0AAV7Z651_9EUKA|nr:no exine formation [Anaeramoeba flamelloides]
MKNNTRKMKLTKNFNFLLVGLPCLFIFLYVGGRTVCFVLSLGILFLTILHIIGHQKRILAFFWLLIINLEIALLFIPISARSLEHLPAGSSAFLTSNMFLFIIIFGLYVSFQMEWFSQYFSNETLRILEKALYSSFPSVSSVLLTYASSPFVSLVFLPYVLLGILFVNFLLFVLPQRSSFAISSNMKENENGNYNKKPNQNQKNRNKKVKEKEKEKGKGKKNENENENENEKEKEKEKEKNKKEIELGGTIKIYPTKERNSLKETQILGKAQYLINTILLIVYPTGMEFVVSKNVLLTNKVYSIHLITVFSLTIFFLGLTANRGSIDWIISKRYLKQIRIIFILISTLSLTSCLNYGYLQTLHVGDHISILLLQNMTFILTFLFEFHWLKIINFNKIQQNVFIVFTIIFMGLVARVFLLNIYVSVFLVISAAFLAHFYFAKKLYSLLIFALCITTILILFLYYNIWSIEYHFSEFFGINSKIMSILIISCFLFALIILISLLIKNWNLLGIILTLYCLLLLILEPILCSTDLQGSFIALLSTIFGLIAIYHLVFNKKINQTSHWLSTSFLITKLIVIFQQFFLITTHNNNQNFHQYNQSWNLIFVLPISILISALSSLFYFHSKSHPTYMSRISALAHICCIIGPIFLLVEEFAFKKLAFIARISWTIIISSISLTPLSFKHFSYNSIYKKINFTAFISGIVLLWVSEDLILIIPTVLLIAKISKIVVIYNNLVYKLGFSAILGTTLGIYYSKYYIKYDLDTNLKIVPNLNISILCSITVTFATLTLLTFSQKKRNYKNIKLDEKINFNFLKNKMFHISILLMWISPLFLFIVEKDTFNSVLLITMINLTIALFAKIKPQKSKTIWTNFALIFGIVGSIRISYELGYLQIGTIALSPLWLLLNKDNTIFFSFVSHRKRHIPSFLSSFFILLLSSKNLLFRHHNYFEFLLLIAVLIVDPILFLFAKNRKKMHFILMLLPNTLICFYTKILNTFLLSVIGIIFASIRLIDEDKKLQKKKKYL